MADDAPTIDKYLVLRYAEIPADPEPVLTPDDDCTPAEGTKCEASKYREGFCLELRDECPNPPACEGAVEPGEEGLVPTLIAYSRKQRGNIDQLKKDLEELLPDCDTSPPCPKCHCHDCGVGLAKLRINCSERTVEINPDEECDCREYVWSPRLLRWLLCAILEGIDKLPRDVTGSEDPLPTASAAIARPLRGAWDAGIVLTVGGQARQVNQDVANLESRVAALEKMATGKTKTSPAREPKE